MKISVIVPSKGCSYLEYLFLGLREQTIRPDEVILVLKECNVRWVEELCGGTGLPCVMIEQREGYFTHALNIGKREARGDLLVFTDDDVIPPKMWLSRWIKYHELYKEVAGISSRDIYLDLNGLRILSTPDDAAHVRLYRWFVRPWLERPHPLLKKYMLGIYLTQNYNIAHGPYIPYRQCYSLPFRGVNMSFKAEYIYDIWFPEHPLLKRAPENEQHFGLQLVVKGYDIIYIPDNPILHIVHESLSRTMDKDHLKLEIEIMKKLMKDLVDNLQP